MELRQGQEQLAEVKDETKGEEHAEKTKVHKCDICEQTFTHLARLRRHYRSHSGERPYVCEVCKKDFAVKENLTVHMRTHTKEKPYVCEDCGKGFEHSGKLRRHEKIHSGERPHVCQVCSKGFIQSGQLTIHMRMHSGEKPFQCESCDKKFAGAKQLKIHERIHSGERPYECPECKKSFAYSHVLKFHQLSHSSEKQYRCLCCQSVFSRRAELNAHIRVCANLEAIDLPSGSGISGTSSGGRLPKLSEAGSTSLEEEFLSASPDEESTSSVAGFKKDPFDCSSPESDPGTRGRKRYTEHSKYSEPNASPKKSSVISDVFEFGKHVPKSLPMHFKRELAKTRSQSKILQPGTSQSELSGQRSTPSPSYQPEEKVKSVKSAETLSEVSEPEDLSLRGVRSYQTSEILKERSIKVPKVTRSQPSESVLIVEGSGSSQLYEKATRGIRHTIPGEKHPTTPEVTVKPFEDQKIGSLVSRREINAQTTSYPPEMAIETPLPSLSPGIEQEQVIRTVASELSALDLLKSHTVETTQLPSIAVSSHRPVIVYSTCYNLTPGYSTLSYMCGGRGKPATFSRASEAEGMKKESPKKTPIESQRESQHERGESVIKFAHRSEKQ